MINKICGSECIALRLMRGNQFFFVNLAEAWVSFICVDDNTAAVKCFDVARVMMKVPLRFICPELIQVKIDDRVFTLTLREDASGQL